MGAPAPPGLAPLPPAGVVLRGRLWTGGAAPVVPDGVLVVTADGRVAAAGPAGARPPPDGAWVLGGAGCWVGPGLVDAHVHLAFGDPAGLLAGGVVAARDLGAPLAAALGWRDPGGAPAVTVAGPVLTAPGGYPSRSWGAGGFAREVGTPAQAAAAVADLAAAGVDLVKLALEPAGGAPVPAAAVCRAVVAAAHRAGLPVTAHALSAVMVTRALDAGVDELCHTPTERLPAALVDRLAAAGTPVVSTLRTLTAGGAPGAEAAVRGNAAALVAAGVPLVYGTDLGNAATAPGADPVELALLADAGLGAWGALRAATAPVRVGEPAAAVLLPADPVADPQAWRRPLAVLAGRRCHTYGVTGPGEPGPAGPSGPR